MSLSGADKADLLAFVQEARPGFLAKRGRPDPGVRKLGAGDFICDSCRRAFYRLREEPADDPGEDTNATIQLGIQRSASTHAKCMFGCSSDSLSRVPQAMRDRVLVLHRFYITPDARVCKRHLENYCWQMLASTGHLSDFSASQVEDMVDSLRKLAVLNDVLNFEFLDEMSGSLCLAWTGLNKQDFEALLCELSSLYLQEKKAPNTALQKL